MDRVFQEAIGEERRRLRFSQQKLGKLVGMSKSKLGAIERGERRLSEEEFVKMCIALEVNLATFLPRIYHSLSISLHSLEEELRLQMGKETQAQESETMPEEDTKDVDALFDLGKKVFLRLLKSTGA